MRAILPVLALLLLAACGVPRTVPPATGAPLTAPAAPWRGDGRLRVESDAGAVSCRVLLRVASGGRSAGVAALEDSGVPLVEMVVREDGQDLVRAAAGAARLAPLLADLVRQAYLHPAAAPVAVDGRWREARRGASAWYGGDPCRLRLVITAQGAWALADHRAVGDGAVVARVSGERQGRRFELRLDTVTAEGAGDGTVR